MQAAALIIQMGALGDFVLSLRIAAGLRAAGFAHVAYLCRATAASWAVASGGVDELLDIESGGFHRLFGDARQFVAADWPRLPRRFDATINMLAGGPRGRGGARLAEWTGGPVFDLDPRLRPDFGGHVTEQWFDDLSRAGLALEAGVLKVTVPDEYRRLARARLSALGLCSTAAPGCGNADTAPASKPKSDPRLAVLHVGSGGAAKCWPIENYLSLSEILRADGWNAVAVLGPVEVETWPAGRRAMLASTIPTLSDCSLIELAGICAEADVYIGNDSGATHLAAAVGARTIAVFGPTAPQRWSPIGRRVCIVGPRTGGGTWPSVVDVANAVNAVAAVSGKAGGTTHACTAPSGPAIS